MANPRAAAQPLCHLGEEEGDVEALLREADQDVGDEEEPTACGAGSGPKVVDEAHRVAQWQKQIDYGKNTLAYQAYIKHVPKFKRKLTDPQTPVITKDLSKKRFDGQVRTWRRLLHQFDELAKQDLQGGKGQAAPAPPSPQASRKRDSSGVPKQTSSSRAEDTAGGAAEGAVEQGGRSARGAPRGDRDQSRGQSKGRDGARSERGRQQGERGREPPAHGDGSRGRGAGSDRVRDAGGRDVRARGDGEAAGREGRGSSGRDGRREDAGNRAEGGSGAPRPRLERGSGQRDRDQRDRSQRNQGYRDRRGSQSQAAKQQEAGQGAGAGPSQGGISSWADEVEAEEQGQGRAAAGSGIAVGKSAETARNVPASRWEQMQDDSKDAWDLDGIQL